MDVLKEVASVVLVASLAPACGTILSRKEATPEWDTTVYGGTRLDGAVIAAGVAAPFAGNEGAIVFLLLPFGLIDLPLSIVADTLILPLTISEQFGARREEFHAFVAAIEDGDLARAASIAERSPEVLRGRADSRRTPLHLAVAKGQLDLVAWIAAETARDEAEDQGGETPLMQALSAGRVELVRILLEKGADPNHARQRETPLHRAAAQADPALAEALLDRGASVDAGIENGNTPLFVAVQHDHAGVAELLLARGAAVDPRGHRGETPLHVAAEAGRLAVARVLLDHGADVHARMEDWDPGRVGRWLGGSVDPGTTPLAEAARRGHAEMVELLRSRGGLE